MKVQYIFTKIGKGMYILMITKEQKSKAFLNNSVTLCKNIS